VPGFLRHGVITFAIHLNNRRKVIKTVTPLRASANDKAYCYVVRLEIEAITVIDRVR